jgi:hypothetical protein
MIFQHVMRFENIKRIGALRQFGLALCLLGGWAIGAATAAETQNRPDLVPVVVDASRGYIEVRNVGHAVAEPSQLFVNCSTLHAGKSTPCAAGLHLPGYIEKWNVLSYDVPALQPGAKYPLHLFGSGGFPRNLSDYHMVITSDPLKRIVESDESNNLARLDAMSEKKSAIASQQQKKDLNGKINLSISVNGKAVKTEIRVVKSGETRFAYWTQYQPGGPALPSPIQFALPTGIYDIHIKPYGDNLFIEKTITLEVKSGATINNSINLQTGHLEVHAQAGSETLNAPIGILQNGIPMRGDPRSIMYTPFNVDLAQGNYTLVVTNPKDRWKKSAEIRIKAESDTQKTFTFTRMHAGFIKLHLLMDGKPIPFEFGWTSDTSGYFADANLLSSDTGESIAPIEAVQNDQPAKLGEGIYDLKVHERAVGGKDIVVNRIAVRAGETVEKTVEIRQPGALKIKARWTHQPLNLVACAEYHNPINLNRLGALMGGGSGAGGRSRGDCFSPIVSLAASVSSPGRSDGNIAKETYPKRAAAKSDHGQFSAGDSIEIIEIEPGVYDVTVWPVGHRELEQTLKDVAITAGGDVQRKLEFRWPDQKK